MGDLIKFFETMDLKQGFIFVAFVVVIFIFLTKNVDYIFDRFGVKTKRMLREEKQISDIAELKSHAKKTDTNIDKILSCMDELKTSVNTIGEQVKIMQERNNDMELNSLRDRISQSYRYYKSRGKWNEMEKEAFEGLIKNYESAGGTNGFVHSICVPASYTWNITDE